jgi:CRP-like cAMP-binding protein
VEPQTAPFVRGFARLFDLTEPEQDYLQHLTQATTVVAPRRKLIDGGKKHDQAYILKAGWMIEFKMLRGGRRQIFNFRLPGEIVGVDSLAYTIALHSTATLSECEVAPLSLDAFEKAHRRFPRLAAGLFLLTLREEAIVHQWEANLGRRSAYERTAHLLSELCRRAHLRGLMNGSSFFLPATQQDLADCLGLTPPYVNRILRRMREEQLVRTEERTLEILDAPGLARIGGFDPSYLQGPSLRELDW